MILSTMRGMASRPSTTRRRAPLRRLAGALVAGFALLGLVGCGGDAGDSGAGGEGPLVVATTTQLADFARTVGGDAVEVVTACIQPNVDAHDVDPSPRRPRRPGPRRRDRGATAWAWSPGSTTPSRPRAPTVEVV
jgi:hypothetical protein